MSSFLNLFAKDLIKKYNGNFEHLTIIFPNKRAGLFLAAELSKLIKRPVWMPEIITISEFIAGFSGLKKTDDLILIIKLYKAYIEVSGSEEKFDDFYFWGNMLLNDFDDVDKYLVDAKALFSNLTALKEIETNFAFLDPEQIETIKMFWSSFNPEKRSKEQHEFLQIWDKLYPTYTRFKENLLKEKLCYEGMSIRYFYEHIEEYDIPNHIIFAGFNALSFSERQIFSFFHNKGRASFYWDYDTYYVANTYHEAGQFIRENLKLFPNELDPGHFNNFKYNQKEIEYISVPSNIGQAKLIPGLLEKNINGYSDTAIVLCDERMLAPTIHSIPQEVKKMNITMGYPAQNTAIAGLIHLLGECKKQAKQENGEIFYYYKPIVALLNHELIKNTSPSEIEQITAYIRKNNTVYIPARQLLCNETTASIFQNDAPSIPDYFLRILNTLQTALTDKGNNDYSVEKELIFTLYKQIQALKNTFREEDIQPDDKLYMQIIQKIIRSLSVPFSGEPLEELQLMGLLETRMLDFKNIIILSANEGIIPKTNPASSFIPYNLRVGFKLPTPEHQDALFAYYFYRLLQRGTNIKILYSTGSKGVNSNEMSRYLSQIKYESGLPIKERNFQNHISVRENRPITIHKNEGILHALHSFCISEEKALSPSAMNVYLDCSLKFYFKYIAGIKEKEEVTEELDHRLLGNIFHECSESLYRLYDGQAITLEIMEKLSKDHPLINRHIRNAYTKCYGREVSKLISSGSNELILEVIRKYILRMLEYDKKITPFQIISMEKPYSSGIKIDSENGVEKVYIKGTIDRVDKIKDGIRIIDYKTGSDDNHFNDIPSLFDRENKKRNKAVFQTLLYCLLFSENHQGSEAIIPGIYGMKQMFTPAYSHRIKSANNEAIGFAECQQEFTAHLTGLLKEIFAKEHAFEQTKDENKCRYCNYNSICNK